MDEKTLRKVVRQELSSLDETRVWSYSGKLRRPGKGWSDVYGHVTAHTATDARNLVREIEGVRRLSRKVVLRDLGPARDQAASQPSLSGEFKLP